MLAQQVGKVKVQLTNPGIPDKRYVISTSPVRYVVHAVSCITKQASKNSCFARAYYHKTRFNIGVKKFTFKYKTVRNLLHSQDNDMS